MAMLIARVLIACAIASAHALVIELRRGQRRELDQNAPHRRREDDRGPTAGIHARGVRRRDTVHDVRGPGQQFGDARRLVGDLFEDERLHLWRAAPVARVGLHHDLFTPDLAEKLERPRADRFRKERVLAHALERVLGQHRHAAEVLRDRDGRGLGADPHRVVVDGFRALDKRVDPSPDRARRGVEDARDAEDHVLRRKRRAVVPLHALAQLEDPRRRRLPLPRGRQIRGQLALFVHTGERVEHRVLHVKRRVQELDVRVGDQREQRLDERQRAPRRLLSRHRCARPGQQRGGEQRCRQHGDDSPA